MVQQGSTPLTNQRRRLDVDANNDVAAVDALRVINFIARYGTGAVVANFLGTFSGFVDVSGDGFVTAKDALMVINGIRRERLGGLAGESVSVGPDDSQEANDMALAEYLRESSLF